jgi:GntR family transcriptional regulator
MAWEDRSERISHDTARLIWQQVADDLASDISTGVLPLGSKLPAELELSEIYGVARVTIRRAVGDLVDRGFVVRIHGRGTFVTETLPPPPTKDTATASDEAP